MASDLVVRVGADLKNFSASMRQAEKQLRQFSFKAERLGRDLTTRLTLPIVAVGGAAVGTFAKFDRLEKGLAAISGSSEEGKRQLDSLLGVVKDTRTTLDLQTASRASLQLQAVGLGANQAENALRQLAIAATVGGSAAEDVGEVGRQLAQAAAKGSILQQELRIILERIPSLAGVISQEFGTVTAEGLREAGVSADEFIQRLTGAIEGNERFQNVQGGLAKAIETFGIELQIAGKELGETVAKTLNLEQNLGKLSNFISRAIQGFKNLNPGIQQAIVYSAGLAAAIGPLALGLGAAARVIGTFRSGISLLTNPIANLARTGFGILAKRMVVYTAAANTGALATGIFTGAVNLLKVGVRTLFRPVNLVIGAGLLLKTVFDDLYQNSEAFRQGVATLREWMASLYDIVKQIINGAFNILLNVIEKAVIFFDTLRAGIVGVSRVIFNLAKRIYNFGAGVANFFGFQVEYFENIESVSESWENGFEATLKRLRDARKETAQANEEAKDLAQQPIPTNSTTSTTQPTGPTRPAIFVPVRIAAGFETDQASFAQATQVVSQSVNTIRDRFEELKVVIPGTEIFENYTRGLGIIENKQTVFGQSFDGLSEKIRLAQAALNEALELGFQPYSAQVTALSSELSVLTEQQNAYQEATAKAAAQQEVLSSTFGAVFSKVTSLFDQMAKGSLSFAAVAVKAIRDVIGALIKQGVTALVANTLKGKTGLLGPLALPIAAAAGAGANALFQGLLTAIKVPALADGGVALGPTLALVGEGRGPEAIIPLDKLQNMMNPMSQRIQVTGRLVGTADELYAVVENGAMRRDRFA
ncbi:MAG: tape measure protein [Bacteroidota bacterium]